MSAVRERAGNLVVGLERDFDFRSQAYRDLFAASCATAFQAPLWLDHMHRRLAPALGAGQQTVVVRQEGDGALAAVLPLVSQKVHGIGLLQPADFGLSDSNAVVGRRETLEAMAADPSVREGIRQATAGLGPLIFRKVRPEGFDAKSLFTRPTETANDNDAYHCAVGDDFTTWRNRVLRKKFAKELDRHRRAAEKEVGPYEHREANGPEEIGQAFDFALRAREGRFEDDLVSREPYFGFYRDYAIEAGETGEAITYIGELNGEIVSMLFGLCGDGEYHAVVIAADTQRHERRSPGLQIIYNVIRQRHEAGHNCFDMGLGDPGYKHHFRAEATPMKNFTVSQSVTGAMVTSIYNHAKPVKSLLRRFAPQVR